MFDCFGVTLLRALREVSAFVYADGDIWPCGLLQEVQFADDVVVVKIRRHIWTVGVLTEQIGGHSWCSLGVGPALQVQILNDGFD